jgi:hypothetical protein
MISRRLVIALGIFATLLATGLKEKKIFLLLLSSLRSDMIILSQR